jgi:fumarate reductase subunit D
MSSLKILLHAKKTLNILDDYLNIYLINYFLPRVLAPAGLLLYNNIHILLNKICNIIELIGRLKVTIFIIIGLFANMYRYIFHRLNVIRLIINNLLLLIFNSKDLTNITNIVPKEFGKESNGFPNSTDIINLNEEFLYNDNNHNNSNNRDEGPFNFEE